MKPITSQQTTIAELQKLLELRKIFDCDLSTYIPSSPEKELQAKNQYNDILNKFIPDDDSIEIILEVYLLSKTLSEFKEIIHQHPYLVSLIENFYDYPRPQEPSQDTIQ